MPESRTHVHWTGHAKCKVTWEIMIDALWGEPTENIAVITVTRVTPELEARIVTLLPLLPYLSSREVIRMRAPPPFTYPKTIIST